jgi:hypothetical protein
LFTFNWLLKLRKKVEMPYREKLAWLSLSAIVLTFGPYFAIVFRESSINSPMPNARFLEFYAMAAFLQIVIQVAGRWWFWHKERKEGILTPDERDRAIEYRSIRAAYFVLIAGMILVGCVMPFSAGGWQIVNAALFMIVAAEIVHYGTVVFGYHRYA